MLVHLHKNANDWLNLAITRAPVEVQATLQVSVPTFDEITRILTFEQRYLSDYQAIAQPDFELGATLAMRYAVALGPLERKAG